MDVPLILVPFTSFKAIYSRARGHKVENDKTVLILYNEKTSLKKYQIIFLDDNDKLLN